MVAYDCVPLREPGNLSVGSVWAVLGVVAMLANAIRRLVPVALFPFSQGMGVKGWTVYSATCVFFAYAEGYKGFQLKFSPFVVRRAFLLVEGAPLAHQVLAPAYAMGLFHATRKRKVMSYSLLLGVAFIVMSVKRLSYPLRSIVDAGVVVGLSWGMTATVLLYLKALRGGKAPYVDPCLPMPSSIPP
mmetsp:Transcript_11198/g.30985  ORF Transcript_11198/g.30985 Transcript_11198/m.30985 type:complete len:187 (-) Transcript_11198:157-717(-)|eukprot:CAMPEP_0194512348 /NCGR_PEP_ID=MMETSP0253-20130528/44317_1 /TAXON_ID=2966 /ORGANISM="Noctiluca scintillans" /LENGTH=186 /DNA_ID=CAMNT_0039355783 /DNA_START=1 /DNA_END=561 /DNA_ORIENTATION=-